LSTFLEVDKSLEVRNVIFEIPALFFAKKNGFTSTDKPL
jgi:hypothetical protein